MKRLAVIVAVLAGAAGTTTARADQPEGSRRVCKQRAESMFRTGVDGTAAVELGVDLRRETPRAFACYRVVDGFLSEGPFAGVISAWSDPEHGRAGVSCAKDKAWTDVGCGHNPVVVPAQATTPVGHADAPWGLHVLGIDFRYAFDASTIAVSAETGTQCVEGQCVTGPSRGATGRRSVKYRALGWECTADHVNACTATKRPMGATVGEQDDAPTVTDGTFSVDLPALCVELSTDPICR